MAKSRAASSSSLSTTLRFRGFTLLCTALIVGLFASFATASVTLYNPKKSDGSLTLPGYPERLDAQMWDFFGDDSQNAYNATMPFYVLNFTAGCQIQVPPAQSSGRGQSMQAIEGSAVLAIFPLALQSGCTTYSQLIKQFANVFPQLQANIGLPPIKLAVFGATQNDNEQFGGYDAERVDDYWTINTGGASLAFVGLDTAVKMAGYAKMMVAASSIPMAQFVHDQGPWNEAIFSTWWKGVSYALRALLGIFAAIAVYEIGRQFRFYGFQLSFRVILFLLAIYYLTVAAATGTIERRSNAVLIVQFSSWLLGYILYSSMMLKWLTFMQNIKSIPWLYWGIVVFSVVSMVLMIGSLSAMIVGLFVSNPWVYYYAFKTFTLGNPGTFLAQGIIIMLTAVYYMRRLRRVRLNHGTRTSLQRMTYLIFVMFVGWIIYGVAAALRGAKVTRGVAAYMADGILLYIAPLILFGSVLFILHVQEDLSDTAGREERSTSRSNPGGTRGTQGAGGANTNTSNNHHGKGPQFGSNNTSPYQGGYNLASSHPDNLEYAYSDKMHNEYQSAQATNEYSYYQSHDGQSVMSNQQQQFQQQQQQQQQQPGYQGYNPSYSATGSVRSNNVYPPQQIQQQHNSSSVRSRRFTNSSIK
ncbi:hypothetical protein GQ42DRAFT_48923 [Ramicandelaber brevisporus]|nr:hypothetical protein GQ42DRAFT_48923 [Ramicandelaber brevisporus]